MRISPYISEVLAAACLLASCGGTGGAAEDGPANSGEATEASSTNAVATAASGGTLPQSLPLYPGARDIVTSPEGRITRFVVDARPETVAAFYGKALKEKLGDATVTGGGNFYAASYLDPSGPEQVQLICRGQGDATVVDVGGSKSRAPD
ncbi:hypothetical protein ABS767_12720 [Sphingomonas sp. ST-64]|uniref:Uncharacterized protein n=1 Tax=Sphingomonas plantiphila TaxID=3163295 RepID=A0ABW8YRL6_9SPHN